MPCRQPHASARSEPGKPSLLATSREDAKESSYEHGLGAFSPTRNAPGTPRYGKPKRKKKGFDTIIHRVDGPSLPVLLVGAILGVMFGVRQVSQRVPGQHPPGVPIPASQTGRKKKLALSDHHVGGGEQAGACRTLRSLRSRYIIYLSNAF